MEAAGDHNLHAHAIIRSNIYSTKCDLNYHHYHDWFQPFQKVTERPGVPAGQLGLPITEAKWLYL